MPTWTWKASMGRPVSPCTRRTLVVMDAILKLSAQDSQALTRVLRGGLRHTGQGRRVGPGRQAWAGR